MHSIFDVGESMKHWFATVSIVAKTEGQSKLQVLSCLGRAVDMSWRAIMKLQCDIAISHANAAAVVQY